MRPLAAALLLTPSLAGQATEPGAEDYAAAVQTIHGWLKQHPRLVEKRVLGKSVQGRELFVLRVGASPAAKNAPEMYLGGGIHGHEGSERDVLWMVGNLLARAEKEPVRTLLRTRVLWVQPLINPDGIVADERKNVRGVDLNRNFSGPPAEQICTPKNSRYPGPHPFSEPETRVIRDFLRTRANLRAYLDLHRSASMIVVPEVFRRGHLAQPCLAAFGPLNQAMGGHHRLAGKLRLDQSGFSVDWAWRALGVIAFTWELPGNDAPDFHAVDPRWRGLLHLLAKAGEYRRYAVVRVATYNAFLNRGTAGALVEELRTPDSAQARAVAEVVQRVRPDVLLLNEVDWDAEGEAVSLLTRNYLGRSQNGAPPIRFPFVFLDQSNTGVDSGADLDGNGRRGDPGDAFGFGKFPGQYGMVLLSRFRIDTERIRTFRKFRWQAMPENLLPTAFYPAATQKVLRLSSKSHWDVPIEVHGTTLHCLCAHPTPPVFDGPEDRNGRRNHDEIRLLADYLTPERSRYIVDDAGRRGGLGQGSAFVILGDLNADPRDGDSYPGAIAQLLDHPAIHDPQPRSEGGAAAAQTLGGKNLEHAGDPAMDTGCFGASVGNLRLDYVLPAKHLPVAMAGVYWPKAGRVTARLVGDGKAVVSSDHRLVWVDLVLERR